jgi:nitrous oxide reductase accessory protein NosL
LVVVLAFPLALAAQAPAKPTKADKCPVCGMFVYKYPDWIAQAHFKDGQAFFFDGAKDMFKFLENVKKYASKNDRKDVSSTLVMEYYDLTYIPAQSAWFVMGSDVYGPMGRELIPFAKEGDAKGFLKDHKGTSVLTFDQVTPEVLKKLE